MLTVEIIANIYAQIIMFYTNARIKQSVIENINDIIIIKY